MKDTLVDSDGMRVLPLPIRLCQVEGARYRNSGELIFGSAIIAAFVGGVAFLVMRLLLRVKIASAVDVTLALSGICFTWVLWRIFSRRKCVAKGGLPVTTVEFSRDRVRCRDLTDGDAKWTELTKFRWVLGADETKDKRFLRSDENPSLPALHQNNFVIEAAMLKDAAQSNEFGYYDRGEIQFELRNFVVGPSTRERADWIVGWLNDLQRSAFENGLDERAPLSVPAWLNAKSPPTDLAVKRAPTISRVGK